MGAFRSLERPTRRAVGAAAAADYKRAVGRSLHALDLLPHESLFGGGHTVRRLLRENRHMSNMRSPGGKTVDEDELLARIARADFIDRAGEPVGAEQADEIRTRLVAAISDPAARAQTTFEEWRQVHLVPKVTKGLGTQIFDVLETQQPELVPAYDKLDVQDDLDSGSAEAALRLLDGGDVDGGELIATVLPPRLRRRLERLAAPTDHKAVDPLRELIRILASLEAPPDEGGTVPAGAG